MYIEEKLPVFHNYLVRKEFLKITQKKPRSLWPNPSNKNSLKISYQKKLNNKPNGSTEMAHKYLACQFFLKIAVVHGSLK